jgi:uncharacterized protein YjeT (DUF2065 family)
MIRVGCCFLVIGVILASPLADLLPVDTSDWLSGVFSRQAHSRFYRVVPAENNNLTVIGIALIVIGFLLAGMGLLTRRGV